VGTLVTPRPWFRLDSTFLTRGSIEALGDECGPVGPLAILALIGEAEGAIGTGKRTDFDVVGWRYSYMARRIFSDADATRHAIAEAVKIGLLAMVAEHDDTFTVRLLRWQEWHAKDPGGAVRTQATRRRKAAPCDL
jgi:hypothetical protein